MAAFLDTVPLSPPPLSERMLDAIAGLAEFTAVARSPVPFDQRGEIDYIPAPEGPGRLDVPHAGGAYHRRWRPRSPGWIPISSAPRSTP